MKPSLTVLLCCLLGAADTEPTEVGFGSLAGYEYVEGMQLPADVTKWDGESVEISGFMRREDASGDGPVEFFMLVYDQCGCEGSPKLNEVVFCAMPEGTTTEIAAGTATVTGTLWVGEEKDGDVVVSVYTLDVDTVDS